MNENFTDIVELEKVSHEIKTRMETELKPNEQVLQELQEKSRLYVESLSKENLSDITVQNNAKDSIENIGVAVQRQAAKQSELLRNPISTLSKRAEDGGDVANALIDLKVTVESLDPAAVDFEAGWFTRVLGLIPGVGTPLKRYFTKFESAQTVIDSIIRSLQMGQDQLTRDNITLRDDQKQLWETSQEIEYWLDYTQALDQQLDRYVSSGNLDAEKTAFIQEEILFPLRQRIMDLQQQLAVQRQGIIATELIMRNNKELIRGINRSLNVTVTALNTATTIALALAHQKQVIEKVDAVNKTTSKLIQDSAERLKTQGAAIHKQAASTQLDIASLRSAFTDLKAALTDMSEFRIKALPQMSQTINELDLLIEESRVRVKAVEHLEEKKLLS